MASKQAITSLFGLFSILQKVGCSTQILTNFFQAMISCFKAIPSFFFKKTISSNEFFGLCISLIEFLSTFSHLRFFCGSESFMAAQCFGMLTFLEMLI